MRESIKLSLKSSSPGKYYAVTLHAGAPLRLSCACAAGDNGMLCKHVLAVLNADASLLAEHNPPDAWKEALAAIAACRLVGVPLAQMAAPLRMFRGVARRFQCVGEHRGVQVIDDFGHNPAKVAASIRTGSMVTSSSSSRPPFR